MSVKTGEDQAELEDGQLTFAWKPIKDLNNNHVALQNRRLKN